MPDIELLSFTNTTDHNCKALARLTGDVFVDLQKEVDQVFGFMGEKLRNNLLPEHSALRRVSALKAFLLENAIPYTLERTVKPFYNPDGETYNQITYMLSLEHEEHAVFYKMWFG